MLDLEEGLKRYFGYNAFRDNQKEIIESIVSGKDVLAILPTGAGKSLCYQLPAMMLPGIAIVISPLISLMQDQVVSLNKSGVSAAFLNSSLRGSDARELLGNLSDYKLLFIAPERLANEEFLEQLEGLSPSFFAIDEAHCISQWGHSFRPEYRQLSMLKKKFPGCPVLGLTATATPEVERDITEQLSMKDPKVIKSGFDRPNLTIRINEKQDAQVQLRKFLEKHQGESGIIYCATRKSVESIYSQLKADGLPVGKYHGGMTDTDRSEGQHAFIYDEVKLMVATIAFGMGIHKPDIRFIVHVDMPKTIEQYYQEIGRAGRDGLPSECLMLYAGQDLFTYRYFIDQIEDPVEQRELGKKLDSMYRLCAGMDCRRVELLKYFGEKYLESTCKNCDNCLDDVDLVDGTVNAQKILSCIKRIGQNFGAKMVIDVLRGSKGKKVLERGFDQLSTYNLMPECSEQEIRYYIDALIQMGYIHRTAGEYPILEWNEKSHEVIRGAIKVSFRKRTFKDSRRVDPDTKKYDRSLFDALRKLRIELAHEESVPAFVIFSDRTLMEMASSVPETREEFLDINGVGPLKWEKYGEVFLKAIREFKPVKKVPDSANESLALFRSGKGIPEICRIRGLAASTVTDHLTSMMASGESIDIDRLVKKERQDLIRSAIEKVGTEKLKPIKESLPEEVSYEEIKFVVALCIGNLSAESSKN